MLIAESGRVHLHGVVTRDVVHVNSGVREGSPSRHSYEQARPKPFGGPKQNLIQTFWGPPSHHRGVTRKNNSRFLTGGDGRDC